MTGNLKAPTPSPVELTRDPVYRTFSKLFSFSIICWCSFSEAKAAWYPATLNIVHGVSRFLGNLIINAKRVTGGLGSRKHRVSTHRLRTVIYRNLETMFFFFDFKAQSKVVNWNYSLKMLNFGNDSIF